MSKKNKKHKESRIKSLMNGFAKPYLKQFRGNKTRKSYQRSLFYFFKYAISEGFNTKEKIIGGSRILVQEYAEHLKETGYTPCTVHTYLAPVCSILKIPMNEIKKEKRKASLNTKSRSNPDKKSRHRCDLDNPEFKHLTEFQKKVGIRRSELKRLTGGDLCFDEDFGFMYVLVKKGKGGKTQRQRILPQYEEFVKTYFEGKAQDEKIFKDEEFNNELSLHTLRHDLAKEAYAYYLKKIESEPDYADSLRDMLIKIYQRDNKAYTQLLSRGEYTAADLKLKAYEKQMNGTQSLNSENRRLAEKHGLSVTYNNLAVKAVSVLHLSHWRNDVTIYNYLLAY